MKKQQGFTLVEALLIILVISVIGLGGWYVWSQNNKKSTENTEQTTQDTTKDTTPTSETPTQPAEEVRTTYTVNELNLSYSIPKDWTHKLLPEDPTILIRSPDFVEKEGIYGGSEKGAEIHIFRTKLYGTEQPIGVTGTEADKKIDGLETRKYDWSYEGPDRLVVIARTNGYEYQVIYKDTKSADYTKYIDEFWKIVESIDIK